MRKFIIVLILLVLTAGTTLAQDATPLEFDTLIEGELDNSTFEIEYVFEGAAGEFVLIEMLPAPGTYDLDPALVLLDADGEQIANSDSFDGWDALVVAELPDDGEYTVLATRSGGTTGDTEGDYVLRARFVEPLTSGTSFEATIYSDMGKAIPERAILYPQEDGAMQITFNQEVGELFASLKFFDWQTGDEGSTLFSLDNSSGLGRATFALPVESETFYVLSVDKALFSFSFGKDESTTVKITVE
ncbi:MAG TPA: hypothetical protein VHO69_01460 [Phototrophicaceae bacterium]|nr:hypothetical protein [Phototrophicaceae bacterium]